LRTQTEFPSGKLAALSFAPQRQEIAMTRGLGGHSPANVSHHLKGLDFPAHKQDVMRQARDNGAGRDVLEVIESMPDAEFGNMADVMKVYGEADNRPEGRH
jgi:Protein of unknown function (DUF2795)